MTSKKTKKPSRKLRILKKERTRQAILAAAEEFFSKKPMNEVSLEDIAEAAFVSRTTLYNYFINKDAIFFGLGTQRIFEATNRYESLYPNDLPGIEQFLELYETAHAIGRDRPLIRGIIREFYKRVNDNNIPFKTPSAKFLKNIETGKFDKLIKGFEEPYLSEFYVQLMRYYKVWMNLIQKGKADGSITNDLDNAQIAQFIFMLDCGIQDEMDIRKSALENIGFDESKISRIILNLITSFLKG